MSYLVVIGGFGWAVVLFLWLRDARIFFRTASPSYRSAAYRGVLYLALATLGGAFVWSGSETEILGLGVILGALYLQGRCPREKVWGSEGQWERLTGRTRRRKDKGPD